MGRAPHQGRWMRASAADDEAVQRALGECELADLAERVASELSGGEQRRVAIARALAQQAPVLLLDEPASHLDLKHAAATWKLVTRACRERDLVCLAVLHDLAAAARFADEVVLMAEGRIVAQGAPRAVLSAENVERVFGARVEVSTAADGFPVFVTL
jgi:iron complex transport system ATP-binding protein